MKKTSRSKTTCSNKKSKRSFFRFSKRSTRLKRPAYFVFSLALLPLLVAVLHQLGRMFPAMGADGWRSWVFYALGMIGYGLIEILFRKPMWMYVVGHELTHALSGLLSGADIHDFRASASGGEVKLSKSNAFIALSPYVVPIYLVFVVLMYAALKPWFAGPKLTSGFQFFIGFSLAFHVSLTYYALHKHQPDLRILGYFPSMIIIGLGNGLIITSLCLSLFKTTPTVGEYARLIKNDTAIIWNYVGQTTIRGVKWGWAQINTSPPFNVAEKTPEN